MSDLKTLEDKYRAAQKAFAENRTEENHKAYKDAKAEFEAARVAQRQSEELDPDHPRGQTLVAAENGNGE